MPLEPYIIIEGPVSFLYSRDDICAALEDPSAALELYEKSTKVIKEMNVSHYQAWFARDLFVRKFKLSIENEIAFCHSVLLEDTKNYQGWNYRRRMFELLMEGTQAESVKSELLKTEREQVLFFIEEDSKHYNAFEYLQWMLEKWPAGVCVSSLFDFTTDLIRLDPFNNSAWNFRYWLLSRTHSANQIDQCLNFELWRTAHLISVEGIPNESAVNFIYGILRQAHPTVNEDHWGTVLPPLLTREAPELPMSHLIIALLDTRRSPQRERAFVLAQSTCLRRQGVGLADEEPELSSSPSRSD